MIIEYVSYMAMEDVLILNVNDYGWIIDYIVEPLIG